MNGIHDMGGMHGFGAVAPEDDEPVFHADWERRVFALASAIPAPWSLDEDRHACENRAPADYLSMSYYEIWLTAAETLLVRHGIVTAKELACGRARAPADTSLKPLRADAVHALLAKGSPAVREARHPARFGTGATVRALNLNPRGHTRLPRYVRGRRGTVRRVHGCHVFPDSNAHGAGEQPQWLYGVEFPAPELWGEAAGGRDWVMVDLWEPYLEAA